MTGLYFDFVSSVMDSCEVFNIFWLSLCFGLESFPSNPSIKFPVTPLLMSLRFSVPTICSPKLKG